MVRSNVRPSMSLSTSVLTDVASVLRSTTMAMIDCTPQRLPSARPIDHRWDRSRGIIFSRSGQNATQDLTRSSGNATGFVQTPWTKRSYAIRHLGKSKTANKADLVATYKSGGFQVSLEDDARLRGEHTVLEDQVKTLSREKQTLEAEHEARTQELKVAEQELEIARRQAEEATAELTHKLEDQAPILLRKLEDQTAHYIRRIEEQRARYNVDVARLKEESDPQRRENDAVLAAARKQGQQSARLVHEEEMRRLEAQYEEKLRSFEAQHEYQMKQEAEHGHVIKGLRRALKAEEAKLASKIKELEEQRSTFEPTQSHNRELQQQLQSRRERETADRPDYATYRQLYNDLLSQVYSLCGTLKTVREITSKESRLWEESAEVFQTSKTLRLFRQQERYQDLKRTINAFLTGRAVNTRATEQALEKLGDKLVADMAPFRASSHASRSLTRYHHLEDAHSNFEMMDLAFMISHVEPFREPRDVCRTQIDSIDKEVGQARKASNYVKVVRLLEHRKELEDHQTFWNRLLSVFEKLRKIKAYEALLNDTAVEKAVFFRSIDEAEHLSRAVEDYHAVTERSGALVDLGVKDSELREHRGTWRQQEGDARSSFEKFEMSVRKTTLLQYELGQLGREDQEKHDREILRRTEIARLRLDIDLRALRPKIKSSLHRSRKALTATEPFRFMAESSAALLPVVRTSAKAPSTHRAQTSAKTSSGVNSAQKAVVWKKKFKRLLQKKRKMLAGASSESQADNAKIKIIEQQMQRLEKKLQPHQVEHVSAQAVSDATARQTTQERSIQGSLSDELHATEDQEEGVKETPSKLKPMRRRPGRRQADHADLASLRKQLKRGIRHGSGGNALKIKPASPMIARRSNVPTSLSNIRYFHSATLQQDSSLDTVNTSRSNNTHEKPLPSSLPFSSLCETMTCNAATRNTADDAVLGTVIHEPRSSSCTLPEPQTPQNSTSFCQPREQVTHNAIAEQSHAQPVSEEPQSRGSNKAKSDDNPNPDLTYQILAKDYRDAVMSSRNTNAAFWSYRLYKGSAGKYPSVLYCTSLETAEKQAKLFLNQPILGFDMEWESGATLKTGSIKRNVSLIQLASEDKIGLFQIALFAGDTVEKLLPPTLQTILVSPDVAKAGVNIRGDATRLEQCLGVKMQGMFELSHLYRVVKFSENEPQKVNFRPVSLADQVQDVLLLPLKKDENRTSAWSRKLNTQQTDYAASDAYAGFRLYHALESQRKGMKPTPPRPGFHELNEALVLGDGTKVFRRERRPIARAIKKAVGEVEEEIEEEDEEFFDAVEELDMYELGTGEAAVDGPAPDDLRINGDTATKDERSKLSDVDGAPPGQVLPCNFTWQQSLGIVFAPTPTNKIESQDNQSTRDCPTSSDTTSYATSDTKPESKSRQPDTPQLALANAWLKTYLASMREKKPSARPNELRAYHLWHGQGIKPQDVAAILKDPPLNSTTVASYILNAIKMNDLPCEGQKVRDVLKILPTSVHWRYGRVVEKANGKS